MGGATRLLRRASDQEGTSGEPFRFEWVQNRLRPTSPTSCRFSSTFSEIAPTARVPRDLKDFGELAIEAS